MTIEEKPRLAYMFISEDSKEFNSSAADYLIAFNPFFLRELQDKPGTINFAINFGIMNLKTKDNVLGIKCLSPDNEIILEGDIPIEDSQIEFKSENESLTFRSSMAVEDFKLNTPGEYKFTLYLNGQFLGSSFLLINFKNGSEDGVSDD